MKAPSTKKLAELKPPPTIGRSVLYRAPIDRGGRIYAAMITRVHPEPEQPPQGPAHLVDLVTFGAKSMQFQHRIQFSGGAEPGRWFWPPTG